jgi:hypothetical protein
MFSQKSKYNQKVQECESLHTELLGRIVTTTPFASSTSQPEPSAALPSSRVDSLTSFPSKIASPLGFTRSASVAPTPPTTHSVAPSTNCPDNDDDSTQRRPSSLLAHINAATRTTILGGKSSHGVTGRRPAHARYSFDGSGVAELRLVVGQELEIIDDRDHS